MRSDNTTTPLPLPDPLERAPRAPSCATNAHVASGADGADGADESDRITIDSIRLAPAALHGALVALISRDTGSLALSDAQRLSHFPASPIVTISWYQGVDAGLIRHGVDGPSWRPFGAPVVISGSQSHPVVSWTPTTGCGHMACFTPDAAQALFGLDLADIQDRFVPVDQVLDRTWSPLWDALLASRGDAALAVLEDHLAPRWQRLQGRMSAQPSLRQLGRHWVERLAWQAHEWRRAHSPRHVERRVKSFSGRSLREWQGLVRTEGLFFAARERYESGQPFDWARLAQDEGFADQAHMSRTTKRITGFSPSEFASRYIEDESFWMYRLWV